MGTDLEIKLSDYTIRPGLRYVYQSPYSGQWFNQVFADKIDSKFKLNQKVHIDINDILGLNSSFIDAVFGRLVRIHSYDTVKSLLTISAETVAYAIEDIERIMLKNKGLSQTFDDINYMTSHMDIVSND